MTAFYFMSTRHYIKARSAFTKGLIRAPTLLIYSNADPLSTPPINAAVVKELNEHQLPVGQIIHVRGFF